jgi:Dolichyl-phosphate-mannose-protein mannosyltransferase
MKVAGRASGDPNRALVPGIALLLAAVAGLAIYGVYLYRHTCFAVGGSDSSGYANAARALIDGALVSPIPGLERFGLAGSEATAFTPLGYVLLPGPTMTPLYPVGFPLHVVVAAQLAGWELGPYLISPIAALLVLLLVFLVGRELGLPRGWAVAAAVVLAACPVFVFQAIQPMSDVIATAWCLAAILAALRSRQDVRWAVAAGFAFGMAVLVRPLDALVAVPLLFAVPPTRRARGLFLAGGLPCAGVLFAYNIACFRSPFQTGYGLYGLGRHFAWSNFPVRLPRYALWAVQMFTPVVCLGWAASLGDRRVPGRDRALLWTWFGTFLFAYAFYEPADAWWYTRFLLPGLPALPLGFALVVRDLHRTVASRSAAWSRAVGVAAVLAIALIARDGLRSARRLGVLELHRLQKDFPDGCRRAAREFPPGALVLSGEMSGALRYYTALTPVRWEALDPERFRALRAKTEPAGGRWFALLMKHEVHEAAARVPGSWTFLGESGSVTLWRLEPGNP